MSEVYTDLDGALANLKDELNKYGIAITAVQEIRWSGSEISLETKYNYSVI